MEAAALPERCACFERKGQRRPQSEPGEKRRRTIRKGLARRYHRPHPAVPATTCPPDTVAKRQQRGPAGHQIDAAQAESRSGNPCGCEIGVQIGSKPRQHGSTCGRVRRAHQVKSSDAALFPDVPRRHEPEMVVLWTLPARLLHRQGIRVVPCTGTSTPRHGETTHSVAVGKRRYTSPCTFSKC